MENFTLNTIVDYARSKGFKNIMGEYIPTPKNSMVQDHYFQLGFSKVDDPMKHYFKLNVSEYKEKESYITAI
jgi:predicted enzyme involved in methoxymalonyl-ACP biosynthesis